MLRPATRAAVIRNHTFFKIRSASTDELPVQRFSFFLLKTVVVVGVLAVAALMVLDVTGRDDAAGEASGLVTNQAGLHPGLISDDTSELFDQETLRTYAFELDPADLAFLDADPVAEVYVPATLRVDGLAVGEVGLRYKGSVGAFVGCTESNIVLEPGGAKTCTKLSMKTKVNWDGNGQEFFGVRRLQFHSQNLDPSHLRERLGYWIFAEMGVPSPRSVHARVEVNGEYVGLFALTENIDGRFVREFFDDGSGNLYKATWPTASHGAVREEADFLSALRTNEDDSDVSAAMIQQFAADVIADPTTARAALDRWTDLDTLLTYFAIDRAIRHDDGPLHWWCGGRGCGNSNFFWYEEPDADLVHLIPWDLDGAFENLGTEVNEITWVADDFGQIRNDCEPFLAFAGAQPQRSAACDPILAAAASFETELAAIDAALRNGPFTRIDEQLELWTSQIRRSVVQADNTHDDAVTIEGWEQAVQQLRVDLGLASPTGTADDGE